MTETQTGNQIVMVENAHYTVGVDTQGRLVHLARKGSGLGNIIKGGAVSLLRTVLKQGENWELPSCESNQRYAVHKEGSRLIIEASKLSCLDCEQAITIRLVVQLDGKYLWFSGSLTNESDCMVTDVYYPCVGSVQSLAGGKPALLWPDCTGQYIDAIADHLGKQDENGGTQVLSASYPGPLSMQWMSLVDGKEVLYYAGHDELFHTSTLRVVSVEAPQGRAVNLEIDKMAFVKPGETWDLPPCVLSLYEGSWREGADEYAAWAKTWRKPVEKADWIKQMHGYFLVICKQQYGDELWPYTSIADLYAYAKEYGCDTVGLFGWYDSGHDNQYPDLKVSESLGGEKALREGIAEVQKQGGHVTLYYQGHLMDVNSPYYLEKGRALEGRNIWNTPYYEDYSKSFSSDFLKFFSKKKFSTVCPSCPQWHDLMTEKAQWVADFGPDGILYDQIGGMPSYPCFNDEHPHLHNRPSLSYTQGRLQLLKKIHDKVRSIAPGFAFMTEHETDLYSQFPDALHGIGVCPSPRSGKKAGTSWTSLSSTAPYMFRYCFPETILTLRNPSPFLAPRYVNYAFSYGFRYEMEIRYLGDKQALMTQEKPAWKQYARQVANLRMKYADMLLEGTYRGMDGLVCSNANLTLSKFCGSSRSCIVVWNDTLEVQKIAISSNRGVAAWETIEGQGEGMPETIKAESVMILLLD